MLREPITLQRQSTASIGGGATTVTYIDYGTDRAHIKSLSGGERMMAERLDATVRMRMVIRYRSDITESDRIIFRSKAYNIRYIDNVEFRNRWLVLDLDGGVAT
jgi:SPP1 family predicted phage head-tail adaptor